MRLANWWRRIKRGKNKKEVVNLLFYHKQMQSFDPFKGLTFQKYSRLIIEQHRIWHWIRRELEFDSRNELPDAGVLLAGRMNRTWSFQFLIIEKKKLRPYLCQDMRSSSNWGFRQGEPNIASCLTIGLVQKYKSFPTERFGRTISWRFRNLLPAPFDRPIQTGVYLPGAEAKHRINQLDG